MNSTPLRRDFLKAVPLAAGMLAGSFQNAGAQPDASSSRHRLDSFDFHGVRLHPSRWQAQYQAGRDYYYAVSDDDTLQGFRAAAGLPAPGTPLGGWCAKDSATVFGQWLSGMSRMYRLSGDSAIRDKAVHLMTEWAKTIAPDGDPRMRSPLSGQPAYPYEKLVCGLVDMHLYADGKEAIPLLERVTSWAGKTINRDRIPAAPQPNMHSGQPREWYTLSENLYRAWQVSGNPDFRNFAEVWLYHPYWNKFADTAAPANAHGVHAYSHVNTFSSAAMHYEVTGDPATLRILVNAYDYLQRTQCFATGGYGPDEWLLAPDGSLGKSLDDRANTFEAVCGSWAGFKLASYLMRFTGEARYGDWSEQLLYNGVGAALPITGQGRHFYYADYRMNAAVKVYNRTQYTCCAGSYIQNMAEYHNQIYYKDPAALYVNLYLPSEVSWPRPEGEVKLVQETRYPEADTTTLKLEMKQSLAFPLKFRVPGWSRDVSVKVNGAAANVACKPGTWAAISRTWKSGDRVEVRIPLAARYVAVDPQHPKRVAVVRGPVVMVQDRIAGQPPARLPETADNLDKVLAGGDAKFQPFYAVGESYPYRIYFDLDKPPAA